MNENSAPYGAEFFLTMGKNNDILIKIKVARRDVNGDQNSGAGVPVCA